MKSHSGTHKAPFIGELAVKGGLRVKGRALRTKPLAVYFLQSVTHVYFHRLYAIS